MLRAAVAAGTPIGLKAKDIMARGELVPDDVVVAIVGDRIEQPDARRGFILDGFPRTVPQAEALDRILAKKGQRLDAVVELKVDPDILLRRIENRVEQMKLRGEPLRADDNPEVLKQRLTAYQAQTAPLVDYYRRQGSLRTVDGMASISDVGAAVGRALADAAFRPVVHKAKPARKASSKPHNEPRRGHEPPRGNKRLAKGKPSKAAPRRQAAAKAASKAAPGAAGKPAARQAAGNRPKSRKSARARRLTK
jgi:adenylate kinase